MSIFSKSKPDEPVARGKFIVIDGPDGTGKKTQTDLLAQTLAVSGYDGMMFDFPQYGRVSSAMLEKYLNGDYGALNAEAASIFYAIDRFDASFKLRELLEKGKIILSNRYVTSNAGHQGAKIHDYDERIKFYRWLDNLEYGTYNVPKADLNIILHIPSDMAMELIDARSLKENRKKDIHEQDPEHLKRAEEVYLEIAELFPNTRLVECVENGRLLSPTEVHAKVWELVRRIALKDVEPTLERSL
ncbi:MAG TPA: thymidylate kinase [Patescibacteria group bacterium]|jgi:dTMP kinase|nr:thymidylate kinase [Patescibacteria group bacterium]